MCADRGAGIDEVRVEELEAADIVEVDVDVAGLPGTADVAEENAGCGCGCGCWC